MARTMDAKPWTADELGRLPAGWRMLADFVAADDLGEVVAGEVGFRLGRSPDTLRGADVAFLSHERLAPVADRKGFLDVPPDLAVEIHAPSEPDLTRKVQQYLGSGVRAVRVVDPESRSLTRHAPGEAPRTWTDPAAVVKEPVLPGFSCRLRDLFGA